MADEEPSNLTQDGYLSVETNSKHIIYHPNLNTILVSTAAADVHVIDVNSGVILHKSSLSGRSEGSLQGIYLAGHDKILYTDGYGIGARRDYNGVMLLDTILQTPKTKPEEIVKLEILLSEALVLEQCLRVMDLTGVDQTAEVLHELMLKISIAQDIPKKGGKAQKWKTVCLELAHGSFREVFGGLVHELKRQNRHIPPLSIGSALLERLDALLPPPGGGGGNPLSEVVAPERALMYSETARRDTFSKWPHMNYKWALPDQMAQAGFYHQPNSTGDDRAMCFTCNVCLVCWEPTDEPWSEHERHSPSCPFVKGEYTQNVPLSVSHATSPGVLASNDSHRAPMSLGTSSVPELIPSTTPNGYVAIWNISRHLKREVAFHVVPGKDAAALAWSDDTESNHCHLHVTAVSIVGGPQHRYSHFRSRIGNSSTLSGPNSRKSRTSSLTVGSTIMSTLPNLRPCLVVGVNANPAALQQLSPGHTTDLVQAMNDVNEAASTRHAATLDIMKVRDHPSEQGNSFIDYRGLYLLVYDFYYKAEISGISEDRAGNGGTHSGNIGGSGSGNDGSSGGGLSGGIAGGGVKSGPTANALSATGGSSKKLISGTGTSSSSGLRSENNFYQELFLTKFLYDMPVIEDVDTEIAVMPNDWIEFATPASSSSGHPVIYPFGPTPSNPSTGTIGNEGAGTGSLNGTGTGGSVTFDSMNVSYSTINGTTYSNFPTSEPGVTDSLTPPLLIKLGGNGRLKDSTDPSIDFYKPVEPIAVQCLALPRRYRDSLSVHSLHPTKDGGHLLVVLNRSNDLSYLNISNPSTSMDVEMEDVSATRTQKDSDNSDHIVNCVLLVYALDLASGDVVRVAEQPYLSRELYSSALSPVEVTLLPLTEEEERPELFSFSSREGPQGRASIVCNDGIVRIFDLGTLKIVSQASPEIPNYKFVSSTYCNSLERLCACTDRGSLQFFILENGRLTSEDKEEEPTLIQNPSLGSLFSCCSSEQQLFSESDSTNQLLIHRKQFGLNELKQFSLLTRYENLTPCYAATVPPCWTEMMQAQKQRRHPQHLQQGDEVQHTRTWRLQSDATTWDEHVFEMTLPRSCCIAQVDVKFTLHAPYPDPPNVQVTLLKPNASGIGRRRRDDNISVDQPIHFNLPGNPLNSENPVTSEEYLCDHNSEILCGPMNLASCLDLTDHAGTVSLTGPKLFKIRGRTLLVHIKALASSDSSTKNKNSSLNDERASASKKSKLDTKATSDSWLSLYLNNNGSSTSAVGNHSSNNIGSSAKKLDQLRYYVGCDWIHEISITIRNTRQTLIPNERMQRCAMLECNAFFERLIRVAAGTDSEDFTNENGPFNRSLALDLLIWIATVRLSRHRSSVEDLQRQQLELARVLESNLPLLFHRCLLLSGRSIAHKCVKLVIIVSDGMRNCSDSWGEGESCRFDTSVLEALLEWLPNVVIARTAGSLRWYFLLLSRFMSSDRCADTGQRCVQLLQHVASELSQRADPYHLLLRTRFGLYSTPLEPELFDVEPPTPAKASSVPVTYATVVTGDAASGAPSTATPATGAVPSTSHAPSGTVGSSAAVGGVTGSAGVSNATVGGAVLAAAQAAALAGDALDLRDLLNQTGSSSTGSVLPARLRGLTASHYVKGLLEVEPLHFICHAASDGTKMERLEPSGTTNSANSANTGSGPFEPGNFMCYVWENSNLAFKKSSTHQRSAEDEPMDTDSNMKRKQDKKMTPGPPIHSPPPWHRLLAAPGQHVLVIERMHSGARRFAVLDFGQPVVLTDLTVPACADLVSLSVDIWCQGEETDGQRLVVATDIGSKALVMSDLQPAPVCRFLKITTIGRYGMGTTRCKIPIGSFYGHIAVLPGESFYEPHSLGEIPRDCLPDQISILNALAEDIHCRYSLACTKLRELLSPLLDSETPNMAHMQHFFKLTKELHRSYHPSVDAQRILAAFHECTAYQQQLNLVRMAITRLDEARGGNTKEMIESLGTTSELISNACTDKLRVLAESLLDLLLFLSCNLTMVPAPLSLALSQNSCQRLFQCLCIREDTRMQLAACTLLVRTCATQPWWGEFLANILTHFYAADHTSIFPQDRVFILVTYLGKRSLLGGAPRRSVLEAVFAALVRLLSPLVNSENSYLRAKTDLSLIGWLLLFLSACLDTPTSNVHLTSNGENEAQIPASTLSSATASSSEVKAPKDNHSRMNSTSSRWEFLQGELAMQRRAAAGTRGSSARNYRRKLMKKRHVNTWQAMHAMQHFDDLEMAKKVFHASTQALSALSSQAINLSSKLEAALKQQEQFFKKTLKQQSSKHLKDFMRSGTPIIIEASSILPSVPSSSNTNGAGPSCTLMGSTSAPSTSHTTTTHTENLEINKDLDILPREHCLAVSRGLINLILAMDFTCNMDMFLVACKVAARSALAARPALRLCDIATENQLLHLIRLATWTDQQGAVWGGPWASHAVCCLLHDLVEGGRLYSSIHQSKHQQEQQITTPPTAPVVFSESPPHQTTTQEHLATPSTSTAADLNDNEDDFTASTETFLKVANAIGEGSFQLPSLLESDDSELEDILDDILERKRSFYIKKFGNGTSTSGGTSSGSALAGSSMGGGASGSGAAAAAGIAAGSSGSGSGSGSMAPPQGTNSGSVLVRGGPYSSSSAVSSALDSRLELGVETSAEVALRRLTASSALNMAVSLTAPILQRPPDLRSLTTVWDEHSLLAMLGDDKLYLSAPNDSSYMLANCFERMFVELLPHAGWTNMELLLQLWLNLNLNVEVGESGMSLNSPGAALAGTNFNTSIFNPAAMPTIFLGPRAVSGLIDALTWQPNIGIRAWNLAFQCLTLLANSPLSPTASESLINLPWAPEDEVDIALRGLATVIVGDPQFVPMLLRFLSGSGSLDAPADLATSAAGPSACQAMHDLLVRLQMRCDVVSNDSRPGAALKHLLLKLLHQLVQPGGAISSRRGPLDAQSTFVELLLNLNYLYGDLNTAMKIFESVASLIYNYISTTEKVKCRSVNESGSSTTTDCFGDLLAGASSSRTSEPSGKTSSTNRHSGVSGWDHLARALLRLSCWLIQTPLSNPDSMETSSDDISQTDEHKARNPSNWSHARTVCVADSVLQHAPTMTKLLAALAASNGNSPFFTNRNSEPPSLSNFTSQMIDPHSVSEGLYHLLMTLAIKASTPDLILRPLLDYLSSACPTGFFGVVQLSEPMLWFILCVLETSLKEFNSLGGIRIICENLVRSNQTLINSHPSILSIVTQHLSTAPPLTNINTKKINTPIETYEGLLNFAPLGSISFNNPTAQPADVLLLATPAHRRARTAAWTYYFYPDEQWVELTIALPCAVLLKEVQLQPHLTSLATGPSAVALEASRDAGGVLVPLGPPLRTSGLTYIRLVLPHPEVVSQILIRLYRPRDSSNIGLSQIRLLGSTAFGEIKIRSSNGEFIDQDLTRTSLGWLRLAHVSLCKPTTGSPLAHSVATSAASVNGFLEACCGLLLIPAPAPAFFAANLERVLLRLGLHSRDLGLRLINTLLRNGAMASLDAIDSVVELIFRLCTCIDEATHDRISSLLNWLHETARIAINCTKQSGEENDIYTLVTIAPSVASYIHAAAAVIWESHENIQTLNYDLPSMITNELFSLLYKWSVRVAPNSALKRSIDTLLCSLCAVRPALFPALLHRMDVLVPNHSSRPDDRKDHDPSVENSITDDSKENIALDWHQDEWYSRLTIQPSERIHLSDSQLLTIAASCQSPVCIQQLLDSGLPSLLVQGIIEFCQYENHLWKMSQPMEIENPQPSTSMTDADKTSGRSTFGTDTISSILYFFAEVCTESKMRDWLGSPDGSKFWTPLLALLSAAETLAPTRGECYSRLEAAMVKFLSRCCWCHSSNQQLLARVLCNVIGDHKTFTDSANMSFVHGLSGLTRRLVLQLLLENEKIFVHVRTDFPLHRNATMAASAVPSPTHPRFGAGHYHQLLYLSTETTCSQLISLLTANSLNGGVSHDIGVSGDFGNSGSVSGLIKVRSDLYDVDLTDHLSMAAAGVTARDKRVKEIKNSLQQRSLISKKLRHLAEASASFSSLLAGASGSSSNSNTGYVIQALQHTAWPGGPLPGSATLSQILASVRSLRGFESTITAPCLSLSLGQTTVNSKPLPPDTQGVGVSADRLASSSSLITPLQVFSQRGGLALLARHLPLVYPEAMRFPTSQVSSWPTVSAAEKSNAIASTTPPDHIDADWVKVECPDEFEDFVDALPTGSGSPGAGGLSGSSGRGSFAAVTPTVPPHSLAAFGLFLRLPGYAEVLLRDKRKAQCLLRLVLGVTDDGEGGDIFDSAIASSLHTLPFCVLRQLLDATPLSTDDGLLLRRTTLDVGAVHLLLGCLAVFTHHPQGIDLPGLRPELMLAATGGNGIPFSFLGGIGSDARYGSGGQGATNASAGPTTSTASGPSAGPSGGVAGGGSGTSKSDDKSHLYWAKGTGFGTGSTTQSWNVEQALLRQRSEEEHVTVLLQVLSSYINPGGIVPEGFLSSEGDEDSPGDEDKDSTPNAQLPKLFHELVEKSCLLPAISSYLRNDSVLDMSRHIPLYKAVLRLLRAMALDTQLAALLLPQERRADQLSVVCLLARMNTYVDNYATRLKLNKSGGGRGNSTRCSIAIDESDQDAGLALLIPDIQETARLVQTATERLVLEDDEEDTGNGRGENGGSSGKESRSRRLKNNSGLDRPLANCTLEERYLEVMKRLQFDTFEMISEDSGGGGGYRFAVSYHFEANMRAAGERGHPSRVKRLAQEAVTLSSSLPLSYSSSVFVRCDQDRLDVMKVLITGPADTPYANGCFEFDVYFPPDYPNSPMLINLETTGHHAIRFNPNLYNDGKVCLSVLNTWHGRPEEKWNAHTSSFLQVLVSIQSLILVPEPYFNEPGYERSRGTSSGNQSSLEYNSNICQATVKWAMLEQLRNPCPCFADVIHTHFWLKRDEIIHQIEEWIAELELQSGDSRTGRAISANNMALQRHFRLLKDELGKLKTPVGLEDLENACATSTTSTSTLTATTITTSNSIVTNTISGTSSSTTTTSATTPNEPSTSTTSTSSSSSSEPWRIPSTTTVAVIQQQQANSSSLDDLQLDSEMEKLVSKVCE